MRYSRVLHGVLHTITMPTQPGKGGGEGGATLLLLLIESPREHTHTHVVASVYYNSS